MLSSRLPLVTLAFCAAVSSVGFSSLARAQGAPDGAASAAPAEKKTLLLLKFQIKGDVDPGIATTVNDILASSMVRTNRFKVMTGDDIRSLMELEAGKQNTGCETESCLAEIAGALGAELVITGRVGRLGSLYVVKLSLIEPATASTLSLETLEAESVEVFSQRLRPLAQRFTAVAYGEEIASTPPPPVVTANPPATTKATEPTSVAEESEGGGGLGTMLLIGGGVIGGGALVAAMATGAVATLGLVSVNTANASGADKALHRDIGPVMMSSALAAGAIALVGGGIAAAGLFVE